MFVVRSRTTCPGIVNHHVGAGTRTTLSRQGHLCPLIVIFLVAGMRCLKHGLHRTAQKVSPLAQRLVEPVLRFFCAGNDFFALFGQFGLFLRRGQVQTHGSVLGVETLAGGFLCVAASFGRVGLLVKHIHMGLSLLLHQCIVVFLHVELQLHLFDGKPVGNTLAGLPGTYQTVGARDAPLVDAQLGHRSVKHLLQRGLAVAAGQQNIVPHNFSLLLQLTGLFLDGILYIVVGRAQLCHYSLLLFGLHLQPVGPRREALLAHLLHQFLNGRGIGILSLAQHEGGALQFLGGLPLVELRHVSFLLHQVVVFFPHVTRQNVHRYQVLAQVSRNAVEGPFLVDDGLYGPHLLG